MRILELRKSTRLLGDEPDSIADVLHVKFSQNGVAGKVMLLLPEEWAGWTRAEKVAWGKAEIASYLVNRNHLEAGEVVFPDRAGADTAKDDFENLPGWATWTPAQADTYIDTNVTDLDSAKVVLRRMAQAILHLRDIVIER